MLSDAEKGLQKIMKSVNVHRIKLHMKTGLRKQKVRLSQENAERH